MGPNQTIELILSDRFTWFDQWDVGYFAVRPENEPYRNKEAEAYFQKYVEYADTDLGRALNRFRVNFVNHHWKGFITDIGIGSGTFIETRRGKTQGYDVNPFGERWLIERGLFMNPYEYRPEAITCWDSLEHIRDFYPLILRTKSWVFISTPIYQCKAHVLTSKHFRPNEHYWYFTHDGLIRIMNEFFFDLVENCEEETNLGREGIGTYAFKRR